MGDSRACPSDDGSGGGQALSRLTGRTPSLDLGRPGLREVAALCSWAMGSRGDSTGPSAEQPRPCVFSRALVGVSRCFRPGLGPAHSQSRPTGLSGALHQVDTEASGRSVAVCHFVWSHRTPLIVLRIFCMLSSVYEVLVFTIKPNHQTIVFFNSTKLHTHEVIHCSIVCNYKTRSHPRARPECLSPPAHP